jgi:hypothetical protein
MSQQSLYPPQFEGFTCLGLGAANRKATHYLAEDGGLKEIFDRGEIPRYFRSTNFVYANPQLLLYRKNPEVLSLNNFLTYEQLPESHFDNFTHVIIRSKSGALGLHDPNSYSSLLTAARTISSVSSDVFMASTFKFIKELQ